jgi:hypothetical protein
LENSKKEKEIEIRKKSFIILENAIINEEMVGKNISILRKNIERKQKFEFLSVLQNAIQNV